jgi:hypothetical protein
MRAKLNKLLVNLPAGSDAVYKTEWNLTEIERDSLVEYFLRSWSAVELAEQLVGDDPEKLETIRLWGREYKVHFTGSKEVWNQLQYLAVRGRAMNDPVNNKHPMYWLSFRAGIVDGVKFAYVIVQEDTK